MSPDVALTSTLFVAIAEIGDKTQLLSLMLAARYRRPLPIIAGILIATTLNHALAAGAGHVLGGAVNSAWLGWIVSLSFVAVGLWALVPDTLDEDDGCPCAWSAFAASLVCFFLAEMGDKTQIATIALGARYSDMLAVVVGTTAGMLIANIPAVLLGDKLLSRIPLKLVRYGASALFVSFGIFGLIASVVG